MDEIFKGIGIVVAIILGVSILISILMYIKNKIHNYRLYHKMRTYCIEYIQSVDVENASHPVKYVYNTDYKDISYIKAKNPSDAIKIFFMNVRSFQMCLLKIQEINAIHK